MQVLKDKKLESNLNLTKESATLIKEGLEALPDKRKHTIIYKRIIKEIDIVLTIWDRIIKNERLIKELKTKHPFKQKLPK